MQWKQSYTLDNNRAKTFFIIQLLNPVNMKNKG